MIKYEDEKLSMEGYALDVLSEFGAIAQCLCDFTSEKAAREVVEIGIMKWKERARKDGNTLRADE